MNLPQITAFIGESITKENQDEFKSIIKKIKDVRENEEAYCIFMVFNLMKDEIYFRSYNKLTSNSAVDFKHFGNNSAATSQYYLARESRSLNYLLTSVWNDLYLMLSKYNMQEGELGKIIKQLESSNLINLGTKKGEGKVNFNKFTIINKEKENMVVLKEKSIKINENEYNFEDFIRLFLNDDNKKNRYQLVVPVVYTANKEIILSKHPDYLDIVKLSNNLSSKESSKSDTGNKSNKVCYICHKQKNDVNSVYSKNFSRSGINKIFTTTTINTSTYFKRGDYDYCYSTCKDCYNKLLSGEKIVTEKLSANIAGESVFIIPEGLLDAFNYNHICSIKQNVDLAFKTTEADKWLSDIKTSVFADKIRQYSINFVFYRSDGNSVTVIETIEDVPMFRLEKIIKLFSEYSFKLKEHIKKSMLIGNIYRLIPVKSNKTGKQLDIGRVLSLYKAILSGYSIESKVLISYFSEALDKGLKQLGKARIDNYFNMGLTNYLNGYEDFFIKDLVMNYIILIKTCDELDILNDRIFKYKEKEGCSVQNINTSSYKVNLSITAIERFLEDQRLNDKAKALFYLGVLINRVALAQMEKEHKTKPILKKIQFQGMKSYEIYRLYQDVIEKLRQYNKLTLFSEAVMNRFHYYYGTLEEAWSLSEQSNVFYIMAGYAYMVGTKPPDITQDESDVQDYCFILDEVNDDDEE